MRPESMGKPRALLITGTVGAGKTSVALASGAILAQARIPHAVVDLDMLCQSWPTPPDDPFNLSMALQNLQAVVRNYLAAGARRLLLSGVVENRSERERYREAAGIDLLVCRLRADLDELHRRLRERHAGVDAEMYWHIARAGELDRILDDSRVADFEIRSDGQAVTDVASAALSRAGWI